MLGGIIPRMNEVFRSLTVILDPTILHGTIFKPKMVYPNEWYDKVIAMVRLDYIILDKAYSVRVRI